MVVIVWYLDLQLPLQLVTITTNVCEFKFRSWRGLQHYVKKFVSDLRQVGVLSPRIPVSSTNKTDHHDITELLLKVATYYSTYNLRFGWLVL